MNTKCDDCGRELTADELARNRAENADQDGNSYWCDKCAADHAEMEADAREQCGPELT